MLGFIGGIASCILADWSVIHPLMIIFGLVTYVFSAYQVLFSLTTMLFEAEPEWIQKINGLSKYQDIMIDKCKFMTEAVGRGLFYIFQGTLWLSFASLERIFCLLVGFWMVMIGVMYILIHFGHFDHVVKKMSDGYKSLV